MNFRVKPIVQLSFVQCRSFTTSEVRHGKRNFRKFLMPNVRGTFHDKARKDRIIETYGYREPGIERGNSLQMIPEMEPQLVVPDLEGFQLKPYVSYRAAEVCQGEFTARDLFDAQYSEQVAKDFKAGYRDLEHHTRTVSERLSKEEALQRARQTGSDIFQPKWLTKILQEQ
ncbi:unnamed protein product [Ixodes pacificus]